MANYCYLRVSTLEQNTEKNKLEVLKFANDKKLGSVEFVEEQISGKSNFKNYGLAVDLAHNFFSKVILTFFKTFTKNKS